MDDDGIQDPDGKPEEAANKNDSASSSKRIDELVRRGHLIRNEIDSTELEANDETSKPWAPVLDQHLSHYRIIQKIGAGGMGEVYLARDTKLDRTVALKILPGYVAADTEGLRRFIREAKTASSVNHPNVAHIYEIGEQDSIHFIAMEYIEGQTLFQRIVKQPFKIIEIVDLAIQVADALVVAHSHGITHRDIKPKNIMITPRGQVKVLDFGLAKISKSEGQQPDSHLNTLSATRPGVILGTAPYMSPEQTQGEPLDQRTDLFSLGNVLYEMTTGQQPFSGIRISEIMEQIVKKNPAAIAEFNKNAPAELERIIFKCLEKNPKSRYQTAQELLTDLHNLRRDLDSGGMVATAKLSPRRPRIATIPLIVTLLAGILVFVSWKLLRQAEPERMQLHTVSTFPGSHSAASFSPDSSMIAFVNTINGAQEIWIKNLSTGDPIRISSNNILGDRPRWSPANDQIVFSSGSFGISRESESIWSVAPLGGTPREIIKDGRNPNWSWDGTLLVFERKAEIWIAKADGSGQRRVEGVPKVSLLLADRLPALSPDSSKIVFFQMTNGPLGEYWIISSTEGKAQQMTFDHAAGGGAVWTPDGKFIIFSSSRAGSLTLWKIPASGGDPVPITRGAGFDSDPEISRDGKKLIFTNTKYSDTLKFHDTSTGISRDLLTMKQIVGPVFSKDSNKIAFFSNDHLFTIEKNGTHLTQVTRNKNESNIFPRWSHNGTYLFFYQQRPEPSFRKIAIDGGTSTEVIGNWTYETEYGAQLNPSEEYIVYSKRKEGTLTSTLIRHLKSGKERALPVGLDDPHWSRDGKWIVGYNIIDRVNNSIYICPSEAGHCREITNGINPVWSGDNSRLYFQRKGNLVDGAELWSISIDGSDEKKETELRPMVPIAFFYDVSKTDEIVWIQSSFGTHELWLLEFDPK